MELDHTGKVSLGHIYTQPDPRAYFTTLHELDYCIPQLAKPYFAKLVQEYRQARTIAKPRILDIGCSYGINAALLKCETTIDELNEHYGAADVQQLGHDAMIARDRQFLNSRNQAKNVYFIGLDSAEPALNYGLATGFLDDIVHADLERDDPCPAQQDKLSAADIVISTGCVGYITEATIGRIVRASARNLPWMAHFVLRMFSFDPVIDTLSELGYETVPVEGLFKQRRFASAEEQSEVLDSLAASGVDPTGLESEGWLYAQLFLSRPRDGQP